MSDSQLNLESKTERSVAKAQNYNGGGTPHRKNLNREGGTPHILPEQVDKRGGHHTSKFGHMFIVHTRVGTPHIKIWSHVHTRVGTPHTISNISCW